MNQNSKNGIDGYILEHFSIPISLALTKLLPYQTLNPGTDRANILPPQNLRRSGAGGTISDARLHSSYEIRGRRRTVLSRFPPEFSERSTETLCRRCRSPA